MGFDFHYAALVHFSCRYFPGANQFQKPRSSLGIVLVVVIHAHPRCRSTSRLSSGNRRERLPRPGAGVNSEKKLLRPPGSWSNRSGVKRKVEAFKLCLAGTTEYPTARALALHTSSDDRRGSFNAGVARPGPCRPAGVRNGAFCLPAFTLSLNCRCRFAPLTFSVTLCMCS